MDRPSPSTDSDPPPLSRDVTDGITDFLEALRVEAGLARSTLVAYRRDLESFFRWAAEAGLVRWDDVSADDVLDHLASLRARDTQEATVARRLSAIRMGFRHQVLEGHLKKDPTALLRSPRLRRSLPHVLTVEQVDELLGAFGDDGWRAQRDTALLELLYASGARVSEAVGLTTERIEPRLRVVTLIGKGNKTRVVPLGERSRKSLELWLAEGRLTRPGARERSEVFLTRSGNPMDRVTAWRRVRAAALAVGIRTKLSPHSLRHSFASHLLEGGADLRAVQELLGHASVRTTEIYTHLDADAVRSVHRLYHPRG